MKMDKQVFFRLEKTLKDIKTKLLLNTDIRKLLYYSSESLEGVYDTINIPSVTDVSGNIFLQPIADVDTTPPFDKQVYLTVTAPTFAIKEYSQGEVGISYVVKVMLMIDKNDWVFEQNKIRAMHLLSNIVNELDNCKFELSHALSFYESIETITTKRMIGYSILFATFDGIGEVQNEEG